MALSTIAMVILVLVGADVLIAPGLAPVRVGYLALGALVVLAASAIWEAHRFLRGD